MTYVRSFGLGSYGQVFLNKSIKVLIEAKLQGEGEDGGSGLKKFLYLNHILFRCQEAFSFF